MAVGKSVSKALLDWSGSWIFFNHLLRNKRLSKGKKGLKKRTQDPISRKDFYDIKVRFHFHPTKTYLNRLQAPSTFQIRKYRNFSSLSRTPYLTSNSVGKTLVNKTTGLKNANDALKGRIVEVSLADLQKDEDHAFRKIKLRVDEVQGKSCLTNFHGLDFTSDKLRSLVRKWQTLIEANITVKTTDDYLIRLFAIAFTKRRPNQIKKTTYAASSQIRAIRKKMTEIIQREATSCSLSQLTTKLIPEVIGREIEKATQGIYPLQNVGCLVWFVLWQSWHMTGAYPKGQTAQATQIRSWCSSQSSWRIQHRWSRAKGGARI